MTREEMFEQVCSIITEKLEVNERLSSNPQVIPEITLETEIRSLNLDSLDLTEIIIETEEKFDTEIDENEFTNVMTISDLLDKAEEKLNQGTGKLSVEQQIQKLKQKTE